MGSAVQGKVLKNVVFWNLSLSRIKTAAHTVLSFVYFFVSENNFCSFRLLVGIKGS